MQSRSLRGVGESQIGESSAVPLFLMIACSVIFAPDPRDGIFSSAFSQLTTRSALAIRIPLLYSQQRSWIEAYRASPLKFIKGG